MIYKENIFAAKLRDLEKEYRSLSERLISIQGKTQQELQSQLHDIRRECYEYDMQLEQSAANCSSPAIASLAKIQLEYGENMAELLRKKLPYEMHSGGAVIRGSEEGGTRNKAEAEIWDRAEATALYAEYTIDFAGQAIRQAMIAAISATLLQSQAQELEDREDRRNDRDE